MNKCINYTLVFSAGFALSLLTSIPLQKPHTNSPDNTKATISAVVKAPEQTNASKQKLSYAEPAPKAQIQAANTNNKDLTQKIVDQAKTNPLQPKNPQLDVAIPDAPQWQADEYSVAEPIVDKYRRRLDETLQNEDHDPTWANAMQEKAFQTMESPRVSEANLMEAECRTSMCRMTVNASNAQAVQQLMVRLASTGQLKLNEHQGKVFTLPDGNGGSTITYYAAREGYSLPPAIE